MHDLEFAHSQSDGLAVNNATLVCSYKLHLCGLLPTSIHPVGDLQIILAISSLSGSENCNAC